MISRMRKKFILLAMASVILVLVVLMGIVNIANYVKMDRNADEVLQILKENNGSFPSHSPDIQPAAPTASPGTQKSGTDHTTFDDHRTLSPEIPYEARYFSVLLNSGGTSTEANTGKIAAVSAKQAVIMAQKLLKKGKSTGYFENYKYLSKKTSQGTLYIFLDCSRDLTAVRNFLSNSIFASLFGILAVFLTVVAMSKRAVRPMAESYEKQKKFITNAGHEIKTPLTIIDSCTEVLEMEQGKNKWTDGIRSQVRRLAALTQGLVSLARMDENATRLPMEDFSLSDAVLETLEPFMLLAENHHLRLTADIQPDIHYHGNEQTIRQLCSILADNAVKYALEKSDIHFSLSQKGRKIFLITDNKAENLEKGDQSVFFDRFYRGDTSRSSEKRGYGIGLSMAQSIVMAHNGKISIRCDDGKTLVITVQL